MKTTWPARLGHWLLNLVLIVASVAMLLPILYTVITSFEPSDQQFKIPPVWIPHHVTLHSYRLIFSSIPFLTEILNSVLITVGVVVGSTAVAVLAAYAFARLTFRGSGVLFVGMLVALMVPTQISAIPEFLIIKHLHLINSRWSLIVPALVQVFSIFLLRQHFQTIPRELEDAALIDGAGHFKIIRHVILPLSWPAIAAVCIVTGQYIWNDFFWPNLFLSSQSKMVAPLALVSFSDANGSGALGPVFAGVSIMLVPILIGFVFLQRRLTEGVGFAGVSR
jgi:multiple sugar transport system permease protein